MSRRLASIEGIARKLHRILQESGPRNLNVVRGVVRNGAAELRVARMVKLPDTDRELLERVIGMLFLWGVVEWIGVNKHRRLAARTR